MIPNLFYIDFNPFLYKAEEDAPLNGRKGRESLIIIKHVSQSYEKFNAVKMERISTLP